MRASRSGAGIDDAVGSLDALLELSARQEKEGWARAVAAHYAKARASRPVSCRHEARKTSGVGATSSDEAGVGR